MSTLRPCVKKKLLQVRGAPAIAIVGCLSLAIEISKDECLDKKIMRQEVSLITYYKYY